MLNAQAAAEYLGVHVETLRRLARRGDVPAFKIGKDWRFHRLALEQWMTRAQAPTARRAAPDPPRVLIVDDEPPIGRLLARMVEAAGGVGQPVQSGVAALAALEAQVPDLLFVDLMMPGMDGGRFLEALRDRHPDLPVVIVTGYPDSEVMMRAAQHGPLLLLTKPVDPAHVARALRLVVGDRLEKRALPEGAR